MPTNSNNETNRRPSKRQEQKEFEKQANISSAEQRNTASEEEKTGKRHKKKRRIFPIWLRIIIVLILCVLALLGGLMIGYGIIGDGSPADALDVETWRHILELMGLQS